nr:DUF1294 domain-containing protein [Sphingomonas laterariae]
MAYYLLGLNLVTYLAFWIDKRRARAGLFRVSEAQLLSLAALGGSPGAMLARRHFRHKTRKQPFTAVLMAIIVVQVGALGGLGWVVVERWTA